MATYTISTRWQHWEINRNTVWALIMVAALVAFELFNFSTTEYALGTFFGAHDALGMASWATVLAIAFCGIDFAGLSRLFTPQTEWRKEPKEVWLLTGAWFLGALMNAAMTWWAVASALSENSVRGNELISREHILTFVPLFVAALVWMTRVMLIGTIAAAGDRFLTLGHRTGQGNVRPRTITSAPARPVARPTRTTNIRRRTPLPERVQHNYSYAASVTDPYRQETSEQKPLWDTGPSDNGYRSNRTPYPASARAADEPDFAARRYDFREPPASQAHPAQPARRAPSYRASTTRTVPTASLRAAFGPNEDRLSAREAVEVEEEAPMQDDELVYEDLE